MSATTDKPSLRGRLALAILLLCALSLALHFAAESVLAESASAGVSAAGAFDAHAEDLFLLPVVLIVGGRTARRVVLLALIQHLRGTVSPLLPPPKSI